MLVLESFADSKLLDFSDLSQLTFCINRTLGVSCNIQHKPNIAIRMREGYEGRVRGHMDEMYQVGKK